MAFYNDHIEYEDVEELKYICVRELHNNCKCPRCRNEQRLKEKTQEDIETQSREMEEGTREENKETE